MSISMKGKLTSRLVVRMTPYGDKGFSSKLPKVGKEQISMHVEGVNLLLKSYAMDSNTANAASDVAYSKQTRRKLQYSFSMSSGLRSHAVRSLTLKIVPRAVR